MNVPINTWQLFLCHEEWSLKWKLSSFSLLISTGEYFSARSHTKGHESYINLLLCQWGERVFLIRASLQPVSLLYLYICMHHSMCQNTEKKGCQPAYYRVWAHYRFVFQTAESFDKDILLMQLIHLEELLNLFRN